MKAHPGQPEDGVQATLDGGTIHVQPKGAGRIVQIKMDDWQKYQELRHEASKEKAA